MGGEAPTAAPVEGLTEKHVGQAQLEAPLLNLDMWALLPVRKPLLTKRSRRCRLASTGNTSKEEPAQTFQRSSSTSSRKPRVEVVAQPQVDSGLCGKIVVKPQINPCSNPPFQKNNAAVLFIPRF